MSNPLADALAARRFCYVVELVATGLRREAQLLEVASRLATLPDVVAGSITSYAGGAMGHDPLRVGTAARARGLTPNIHLTCVNGDRQALRKTLEDLHALGIENVFALTGDFPKAQADAGPPRPHSTSTPCSSCASSPRCAGRACPFTSPSPSRRSSTSRRIACIST